VSCYVQHRSLFFLSIPSLGIACFGLTGQIMVKESSAHHSSVSIGHAGSILVLFQDGFSVVEVI
jgi:hypothetical protein